MKEITMKRTAFTSIFTLSIFFLALFAHAQARQEADPLAQRQSQNAGGLLRALNLSPEQRAQIRMLREQNKESAHTARRRLGQAYRALNEAIHADSVDEREIESRVQEVGTAHVEVERLRAQVELQLRRVLTLDQLSALRRIRQQARSERQQRRQENNAPPFSLRKQR